MIATVLLLLLIVVPGLLWIVARSLPDTTHHAAERVLDTDVATLRRVLDAVEHQPRWRRDIARVEVSGNAWTETDARGRVLRFRWTEQSDDRYRLVFEDDQRLRGEWTAAWSPTGDGLRVRVEESITLRHPWSRLLARAFFDPDAFLAAWFDDLEAELSRKATTNG